MKRIFTLIIALWLVLPGAMALADTTTYGGSGSGFSPSTECNAAVYYPIGRFCQDTDDAKIYKGTGAAVVEIGGTFSVTDITGQTDDTTPATTATAVLAQGGSLIESTLGQIGTALGMVTTTVATDPIFDAAGDLVQGTGANTAAKLTKGAEGTILRAGAASNAYSTSTFADTYAKGTFLYNASANTVAGLAHPGAANYLLATNAADTAAWFASSANAISLLGAADYAAMRGLLDLEAGTDFNAYDADLATIAGLTPVENKLMIGAAGPAWSVSAYTLAAPGASGGILQSDGTNWARVTTLTGLSLDIGDAVASGHAVTLDANGVLQTAFANLLPDAADGAALGSATYEWSDLYLADGAVINLGADQDVTLTHVADTGVLINSTRQLQFGDSGTYINQSADGVLNVATDTELKFLINDEDIKLTKTGANGITLGTNTGTLLITSAIGFNVPLQAVEVDGHTDQTALTAAQVSGTTIYNTGQGAADVFLLLPTAAAGYNFIATVGTAQANHFGVEAASGDKIYLIAAAGTVAAGDDNAAVVMTAAQVGQSFACWTFKTDAYDWMCKGISIGTSTFAAHAHSTP